MGSKTNAIRIVEKSKIAYKEASYEYDVNDLSGVHAAEAIGFPSEQVYKTLVAKGSRTGINVFCIPVCAELDLKKAARSAGDKDMVLIPVKDLLELTGYIRGGCSPVGMKKSYPTYFEESCELLLHQDYTAESITLKCEARKDGLHLCLSAMERVCCQSEDPADADIARLILEPLVKEVELQQDESGVHCVHLTLPARGYREK